MDIEAERDLRLLEAVEQNSRITQRGLATKLGIALGLTNIYLKRLARKGYIKCVNVQSNRLTYLITPRAEHGDVPYDLMVVATLDGSGQHWTRLINAGVPPGKLFPLRQMPAPARRAAAAVRNGANGGQR